MVISRYRGGEALKVIAADYGVTTTAVNSLAKKHGVPLRRPRKIKE